MLMPEGCAAGAATGSSDCSQTEKSLFRHSTMQPVGARALPILLGEPFCRGNRPWVHVWAEPQIAEVTPKAI
jgi:hypothetical protein